MKTTQVFVDRQGRFHETAHEVRYWLDSCYVNGTFIAECLKRKGMTDMGLGMVYHDCREGRAKHWTARIKRACRDYFKAGLGLA